MPELCRFFGIIIRMYMEVGVQHQLPHFHAYYQSEAAVFGLDPIELIAGSQPRRQQRLIASGRIDRGLASVAGWSGTHPNRSAGLRSLQMKHAFYRVQSFKAEAPYTLRVGFDDGTEQLIDFEPILHGELFGPLRDLSVFNQVRIDPEVHTLIWPNGADLDPATLHDWPAYAQAIAERAKHWSLSPA
jgi:hypothetical protein